MSIGDVKIAQLDEGQLTKIRELEEKLGSVVVALEPGWEYADLSDEQLAALRSAEKELGLILVACRNS